MYFECKSLTAGIISPSISVSGSPSGRVEGSRGSSFSACWAVAGEDEGGGMRIQRSGLPGATKTTSHLRVALVKVVSDSMDLWFFSQAKHTVNSQSPNDADIDPASTLPCVPESWGPSRA